MFIYKPVWINLPSNISKTQLLNEQDTEHLHSISLYYKLQRFSVCSLQTFRAVLTFDSTFGAPLGVPQNTVSHMESSFQESWGQLSQLARIFQLLNTLPGLNGVEIEWKSLNFQNILNLILAAAITWPHWSMLMIDSPLEALLSYPVLSCPPVLRTVLTPCIGMTFGRLHQRNYPLTLSVLLLTC